ncbi:hypothetical protein TorRG33x02_135360 [Trema orientale]|uniref:Uncharacterized protein n=1 Tax=Trema orientale TaxID=63057 RepID=A0A2P5EYS2_TREOI|nr:hypothetical protein TorRG33x02_135360 [Trema orientale]
MLHPFQSRDPFKKSPPRISSHHHYTHEPEVVMSVEAVEEGEIFSPKQGARVAMLKNRFAETIRKAKNTLDAASYKEATRSGTYSSTHHEVVPLKEKDTGADYSNNSIVIKNRQRSRNIRDNDHDQPLMIKKRGGARDHQADDSDCDQLMMKKRKRQCRRGIGTQRKADDDRELRTNLRKKEIERQREAARIAINKITKTVDFDNLSVLVEFKKLLGSPSTSVYIGL